MIGKILGNRYEIIEKIGEGGMAIVYRAKCNLLNRYVAIKVLRPEFADDDEFVKRFKRESQSAASLSHPNIVSIYDVGCEDNIYYIVMEYVHGKTLKQIIKEKNGPLNTDYAVEIARQVASALDHAHSRGIVHRDIKPQNIIISDDGRAKVTDFGIARAGGNTTLTMGGNLIGTAQYFSPEQAKGGHIDAKSDIYSLGIVLYEMVTGKVPFEGESPISVALKHLQEEIVPPKSINPNIPDSLNMIIMKATQKDPDIRYQSAEELLNDLGLFIKNPYDDFVHLNNTNDEKTRIIKMPDSKNLDEPEKKKPKKGIKKVIIRIAIIALALIALSLIGYAGAMYLNNAMTVKDVTVPNVVGYKMNDAISKLEKMKLKQHIIQTYSDKAVGTVIKQDPESGTDVKVNYTINLYVSRGVQMVDVPDVTGLDIQEATTRLENNGLHANPTYQDDDETPKGVVMSQKPDVSSGKVKKGSYVLLMVSNGSNKTFVPPVVGLNLQDAETALTNNSLKYSVQTQEDTGTENIVLKQSYDANTQVAKNTVVVLTVSKKPANNDNNPPPNNGGGNDNGNGNGSGTTAKTVSATFNLPKSDNPMHVVIKAINGKQQVNIFDKANLTNNDSPLTVQVTGTGKATLQLYVNDKLIPDQTQEVDFK